MAAAGDSTTTIANAASHNQDASEQFGTLLSQKELTFVVSPPEIVFKRYEPFHTYESPLVFKNQTKTVRSVKVLAPHSRFFKVSEPRTSSSTLRVAAGLSVSYTVSFRPEEDADYSCDLIAVTETERFVVQVRAFASRGWLDLPDRFHFANPVIKYKTEKIVLVRNVGIKPTTWELDCPSPWEVTPSQGHLQPGATVQMCLSFQPKELKKYSGALTVRYSNGDTTSIPLTGEPRNVHVSLSESALQLDPTFISLERQGVVTLFNKSDVTIKFKWKSHSDAGEEEYEKHRLAQQLQERVGSERDLIVSSIRSSASASDLLNSKRQLRTLDRHSKSRLSSLEEGCLLFEHEYFTIDPLEGEVPARSQRDVVVTFNPQLATACEVGAFLDVVGRAERLPLALKGQGVGPKCHFSYDALDLGDVFISSIHRYELMLQNRGSIEARFSLNQTVSLFAKNFKFKPAHGTVAPGGAQVIGIEFCSDLIGILNESFFFHIQGSRSDLGIHFKGRVIGPTFHFDVDEIDFGNVSFNFMHRRVFTLINTSEIPMRYKLRVPEDSGLDKEFEMIPAAGLVLPHGRQKITLDFLSNTVQEYNAHLVVDVDEVGDNLHSLPLKASCVVPQLTVLQETLDFGKAGVCFVGHPYTVSIEMRNDTQLSSKYDVGLPPTDDPIRRKLDIEVLNKKGIVPAGSVHAISLRLVAKMVGAVHLPIYIRVLGSDRRIPVSVSAKVTGPVVNIDSSVLDFGKVNVLSEHCKTLELINESPIPAVFSCKLANKCPLAFSLKNNETVIPPRTAFSLPVYCYLDDTVKFHEDLIITVANSKDITVSLSAVGIGTTLVPSISLEHDVDFGNVFTTAVVKKTFTMFNKGKRQLQITWNNDRAKPKEGDPPFTFIISPDRATIPGKSECEFTFEGTNEKSGRATERFVCKLAKTHKMVFRPTVVGLFVVPLVELSEKMLNFSHTWSSDAGEAASVLHTKPLTIRNTSPMTLGVSLKAGAPFTIDKTEYTLRPSECCTVNVELNAGYRNDRVSHKVKTKLSIAYKDHPQKDLIDLAADIAYPNLTLVSNNATVTTSAAEKHCIDFGCIMPESEKRVAVVVTNNSKVNATYEWVFEQPDRPLSTAGTSDGRPAKDAKSASTQSKDNIVLGPSAFDVLPIRGFLKPGESERVEFVYYSMSCKKAKTNAVLVVEGGPEYPLALAGEASSMHFRFDRSVLEFGNISYDKHDEREFYLSNNGKVSFEYKVDLSQFPKPGVLEVSPSSGVIKGGERLRLVTKLFPKVPDRIDGFFQVNVAHFEPHSIYVSAMGLYPSVSLLGSAVTRVRPPEGAVLASEAQKLLASDTRRYFLRNPSSSTGKKGDEVVRGVADLEEEVERLYFSKVLSGALVTDVVPPAKEVATLRAGTETTDPPPEDTDRTLKTKDDETLTVPQDSRRPTDASELSMNETNTAPTVILKDKEKGGEDTALPPNPYSARFFEGKPIIACYAIDFGTIVKGDVKKKSLKIANTSPSSVHLVVDKKRLLNTGVAITPEKIPKMSGHPTYSEQAVDIHLFTKGDRAKDVTFGTYSLSIPVEVRGSGYVLLEVKAFIMVPQLTISHPLDTPLDFHTTEVLADGTTRQRGTTVGEARIVTLQFSNPLPLPCEWVAKCEMKKSQPRNIFLCKPEKGVLLPRQTSSVEVTFVPFEGGLANGMLNIKIAHNPRTVQVPCTGTGEEVVVAVNPPKVVLPAVLPFQTVDAEFTIQNNSFRDVEIYSTAFDTVHLVEAEILRSVNIYNSDGIGYLRPREVGGALDELLLEQYFNTLDASDLELGKLIANFDIEQGTPSDKNAVAPTEANTTQAAAIAQPGQNAVRAANKTPEMPAACPVIVVHGPPLSGKTTVANILASQYNSTILNFDELLERVAGSDTAHGLHVKNLLDPWPGDEAAGGGGIVNIDVLAEILKQEFRDKKMVVIDGLTCKAVKSAEVLASIVSQACEGGDSVRLLVMDLDRQCIDLREARVLEGRCIQTQQDCRVQEIGEDEYDAMDSAERRSYESSLKKLREAKKDAKRATETRTHLEQERTNLPEEELLTILQVIDKEEEARALAEAEEASQKKGKGAAKKGAQQSATETPEVVFSALSPTDQYKKLHPMVLKTLQAQHVFTVVNTDGTDSFKMVQTLFEEGKLPQPDVPENTSSGEACEVVKCPVTKLRVEKPKGAKVAKHCPWFSIIDNNSRPTTPTQADPKAAKGKVEAQPDNAEPPKKHRWILKQNEQVRLSLRFKATQALRDNFEDTIEFGVVGSKQIVPLHVTAVCMHPDVVRDPKISFSTRKSVKKGVFDFGPLLVKERVDAVPAKGAPAKRQSVAKEVADSATEVIKIQNMALFDADITWTFTSADQKAFTVSPTTTKLKAGEMEKLRISASPDTAGVHETQLVGLIKDNPKPVVFNIQCLGCSPDIELLGCEDTAEGSNVVDFGRLLLDVAATKEVSIVNSTPVPLKWELVDSAVPASKLRPEFQVSISGKEMKEEEKCLAKGRLDAKGVSSGRDRETLQIAFQAPKADLMKCELTILVKDEQETTTLQSIPVKLIAEAYDLYLESTEEITFGKNGLVKVGMQQKSQLKLCNRGKYAFSYDIVLKKKLGTYFTLDPACGVLKPKEPPTIVDVTFESRSEVCFRDASKAEFDINIHQGIEPGKLGPVVGSKPIVAEVEARSLRFQVLPSHGLNFGPCLCHAKKRMPLDILNNGPFDLKFKLYDYSQGNVETSPTPDVDKKAAPKKGAKDTKNAGELDIGAFKITPTEGVVCPGDSREVTVLLDPKGSSSKAFAERLGVFIEECNPLEAPSPLLLEGESCTPGISADLNSPEGESIFEEQQIVSKLDAFCKQRSVFAKDDRVFSFGPIITRQSVKESFRVSNPFTVPCTVSASIKKRGESEGAASAMSAFHVAWAATHAGEAQEGNSITIPPHEHRYINATFSPTEMRSYFALFEAVVKDGTDPISKELIFEIRGEGSLPQLHVELQPPPPPRMVAEAVVVDPKKQQKTPTPTPATQRLAPNTLVFYRTVVGKRNIRHITLTNVGDLVTEFKFALPARERETSPFHFPARNESHELPPGASQSYPVYFEPKSADTFTTKITMSVTDNSFEDAVITLQGEACEEHLMFAGLDDGCDNFVTLADCGVSELATHTMKLECHSDSAIRYAWSPERERAEKFQIVPSSGHILPGQVSDVTIKFASNEPEEIEKARLALSFWKIKLHKNATQMWNDTLTSVKWEQDITPPPTPKDQGTVETEDSKDKNKKAKKPEKKGEKTPETPDVVDEPSPEPTLSPEEEEESRKAKELERKRRPLKRVTETTPEPAFDWIDEEDKPQAKDLFVKVTCDHVQWEILADAEGRSLLDHGVSFTTTKLFQTRSVPFVLKNVGKITLDCHWHFESPHGNALSEEERGTFAIEPEFAKIPTASSQAFTLSYSPLDTERHAMNLVGHIPHVREAAEGEGDASCPQFAVNGTAECPLIHFQLQESDYLLSGRNPELSGPTGRFLEPSCKVLEFPCSGVKVRTTRRFFVLNPTNMSYEYEWTDYTKGPDAKKFTCHNTKGVLHSGKRAEMVFDFSPETLELKEACWEFTVGGKRTENFFKPFAVPFLLVGKPSEPNVVLQPSHICYDQVLLGAKSKKTIQLLNSEPIPFSFNFNVGRGAVQVSPTSGQVPANSSLPIEVTFCPTSEESYNVNVVCSVKKKTNALTCNIKGEGYSIHESVVVKSNDGATQLLTPGDVNVIDFGRVHVNSKQTKQIIVSNSGKLHFDYKWSRLPSPLILLTPEIDTVGRSGKSVCDLSFSPTRVVSVDSYKMTCKITNGSTYTVAVMGSGVQPNIQFSVTKIDFGPQFVHHPGSKIPYKKQVLTITNMDNSDVSFECNTDLPAWLESDVTPTVLAKAGTKEAGHYVDRKDVSFYFKPTEPGRTECVLPFEINGMYTVHIHVAGEGTVPRIELAAGFTGSVNFGSVRAGELKTVSVKAVCKSKIATPFSLANCLPTELSQGSLITVTPTDAVVLKPRESRSIEFKFRPPVGMRMAPFSYNIEAEVAGQRRHFVTLLGSSIGVEVHMDQKTLSFGTVVQGTRQTRRVLIMNTGDVPVAYQWPDLEGTGYSVNHVAGVMAPHSEQACDVVFAPTSPIPQSNKEVNVKIVDQTVHPHTSRNLPLSLVGVCSKRPAVAEEHIFKCLVRETCTKNIRVTNPTSEDWVLPPALDNTSWSVPEKVTVPAGGGVDIPVTYSPQVMSKTTGKEGEKDMDTGMLFIPIPTGDAKQMMHSLVGESAPPAAAGELEEALSAKSVHTLLLSVQNWLPSPQRFAVSRDFMLLTPTGTAPIDFSVSITGGATIDVPQKATRKFKLTVISHKECKIKGTVRFLNEATKEYIFYNVALNVGPPKDLRVLDISTPARQAHVEDVFVENPCDVPVTMDVTSSGSAEFTHRDKLSIEPRSTGKLALTYLPLIPQQEKQVKLMLKYAFF